MRVQRGLDTAQDLIEAFPALEQAALNSSSAGGATGAGLTEQDRRRLADLPDAEEEAANIRRVSTRSREELVSTLLSRPEDLSDAELELVRARFWADVTPQEVHTKFEGTADATLAVRERVAEAQHAAQVTPGEWMAYGKAQVEIHKRRQRREDEDNAARLGANQRHTTPAWMKDLARQLEGELQYGAMNRWGFIVLYDAEAREITSHADLERFERTVEDVLRAAMANNGAKATALARRWRLHFFDAPLRPSTANDTSTSNTTTTDLSSSPDEPDGDYHSNLRRAFRAVIESPEWFTILEWDHGVRTDIFLVVDKECIESVLGWRLDDMRIRAYEANFSQADRSSYADGYEGWTWVRLEQLVYRFYGAACTRDDVSLHDIWKAAQASRHKAFVSLDPEVAQSWSTSSYLSGQKEGRYDVHF